VLIKHLFVLLLKISNIKTLIKWNLTLLNKLLRSFRWLGILWRIAESCTSKSRIIILSRRFRCFREKNSLNKQELAWIRNSTYTSLKWWEICSTDQIQLKTSKIHNQNKISITNTKSNIKYLRKYHGQYL
jgi:hypothetical protein